MQSESRKEQKVNALTDKKVGRVRKADIRYTTTITTTSKHSMKRSNNQHNKTDHGNQSQKRLSYPTKRLSSQIS